MNFSVFKNTFFYACNTFQNIIFLRINEVGENRTSDIEVDNTYLMVVASDIPPGPPPINSHPQSLSIKKRK